jgi:hypothetical protein
MLHRKQWNLKINDMDMDVMLPLVSHLSIGIRAAQKALVVNSRVILFLFPEGGPLVSLITTLERYNPFVT